MKQGCLRTKFHLAKTEGPTDVDMKGWLRLSLAGGNFPGARELGARDGQIKPGAWTAASSDQCWRLGLGPIAAALLK